MARSQTSRTSGRVSCSYLDDDGVYIGEDIAKECSRGQRYTESLHIVVVATM